MIHLRKIEPQDLPYLYQWENDAAAWADGDNHNPLSQQDLRQYIESTTGDIYRDGQLRLIIEQFPNRNKRLTRDEQEIAGDRHTLGCIDLFDFDPRNRKAAMGLYIAPEYRGQGLGREAIEALEQYAFTHLALRQIYAIISVNNQPCSHLYESMGYIPTAHLRAWTLEGDAIVWQRLSAISTVP